MSPQVVHHISFRPETKPAFLGACEWTCVKMNEHVSLQVLLFREGLVAVGDGALERLRSKMHVHVSPVSVESTERLLALGAGVLVGGLFLIFLHSLDAVEIFRHGLIFVRASLLLGVDFVVVVHGLIDLRKPVLILLLLTNRRKITGVKQRVGLFHYVFIYLNYLIDLPY